MRVLIGAFAVTNNLFIIAIGLGIGAMFVRSLTIVMVEKVRPQLNRSNFKNGQVGEWLNLLAWKAS
jgi:hypothetical protein